MRRDLPELHERSEQVDRYQRAILRSLDDVDGQWAEEHYDAAHKAMAEAEAALGAVCRELHEWERERIKPCSCDFLCEHPDNCPRPEYGAEGATDRGRESDGAEWQ